MLVSQVRGQWLGATCSLRQPGRDGLRAGAAPRLVVVWPLIDRLAGTVARLCTAHSLTRPEEHSSECFEDEEVTAHKPRSHLPWAPST